MKFILLFIIGLFSLAQLEATKPAFAKGDKVLNLGVGFGSGIYSGFDYTTKIPPISASFEYGARTGVIEAGTVGIGGYAGYTSYEEAHGDWGVKYNDIILGARGTFHYPLAKKLDTYLALVLGYTVSSNAPYGNYSISDSYKTHGGFTYGFAVGGRYYFVEKIAAMAELGVGIVYLNLGVAFKF